MKIFIALVLGIIFCLIAITESKYSFTSHLICLGIGIMIGACVWWDNYDKENG